MQRRLNPHLFPAAPEPAMKTNNVLPEVERNSAWQTNSDLYDMIESQPMLAALDKRSQLQNEREKSDRFIDRIQKLEERILELARDQQQQNHEWQMKWRERQLHDIKLEELFERHNQLINSFAMRLEKMQKILNEKELQLLGAQSALEDTRHEIARLKART